MGKCDKLVRDNPSVRCRRDLEKSTSGPRNCPLLRTQESFGVGERPKESLVGELYASVIQFSKLWNRY